MRARAAGPLLLLLAGAAAPLAAQGGQWASSNFPYLFGDPNTGLMLVGRWQVARQADYFAAPPFDGILGIEGGISAQGSRYLSARFRGPLLADGWRFAGDLLASRESRFGYYGAGNATEPDESIENFNRVRRLRYLARGEVTRRIEGPLHAALGAGIEHWRFTPLPGTTLWGPLTESGTDATARLTLVVDTRDREQVPGKGVLGEVGILAGTGGVDPDIQDALVRGGYTGVWGHFRGYVSPREGTVVAARGAFRNYSRGARTHARYLLPAWERGDLTALGGAESHRSFVRGRFNGRGVLLASLEVRHNLLDLGDYGAVTLIAFGDGGRVFGGSGPDPETFRFTFDGWKVGGGGGLGLRVLRSVALTFNFAGGPEGFVFSMGNGWAF